MAIVATRVTVTDTAGGTALHSGDAGPSGTRLSIRNEGAGSVALGPSGVTFAGGYILKTTETIQLDLVSGDALFAISDTAGSNVIHVLKTGE